MSPDDTDIILGHLERPEAFFGSSTDRDELLIQTLRNAYAECSERMGEDHLDWAWGKIHQGYFEHALATFGPTSSGDVAAASHGWK